MLLVLSSACIIIITMIIIFIWVRQEYPAGKEKKHYLHINIKHKIAWTRLSAKKMSFVYHTFLTHKERENLRAIHAVKNQNDMAMVIIRMIVALLFWFFVKKGLNIYFQPFFCTVHECDRQKNCHNVYWASLLLYCATWYEYHRENKVECDCTMVHTACYLRRTITSNADGGRLIGAMTEAACRARCEASYPRCVAVDYRLSDGYCYTHTTKAGRRWNSCCTRYEIFCGGQLLTLLLLHVTLMLAMCGDRCWQHCKK